MRILLSLILLCVVVTNHALGQVATSNAALWRVDSVDLNVNVLQAERVLNVTATVKGTNVGGSAGRTFTVRLNSKAKINSISANGAVANFRQGQDTRGDLQRAEVSLATAASPGSSATLTINYTFPVETNVGDAAISPIGTHFLPSSFWYPTPNTPFTVRGADTAPFKLTVNLPDIVSSGADRSAAGNSSFDQPLFGQPFFLQGSWEKVEGAGEAKGVTALVLKGSSAEERKNAEALIAIAAAARTYFAASFGPAPDVPVKLVAVRRGAGFNDTGTVLFDANVLRFSKVDAATVLSVSETIARLWFGDQRPIYGEGSGVLRDGLARFLATSFIEKQFGRDAVQSELLRERIAFAAVAKRDSPLARANQSDSTYFGSVPNRGAMFWRLIDRRLGHEAFVEILKTASQSQTGFTLANLRTAIADRGGPAIKTIVDTQLDQVVDTDLLVGLPQARGAEWVSALRNLGSIDVNVSVIGTTDNGQIVRAEAAIPAKNFGEAVFKTSSKIVRVEVDPEKLYPQIDYGNDTVPRVRDLLDGLAEGDRLLGAQDYVKAEAVAREMLTTAPRLQEGRVLLGRALLGQNKLDDAEKVFRASLEEPLPFSATMAWSNIGLGEISMKKNQPAEAAKRFNDAVFASRDYPSSLAARAARIRAEAAANSAPPVDESVRAFVTQLSQAVISNRKADLEAKIIPGELVRFINASIGTEIWDTKVIRTEPLSGDSIAADVTINARKLGKEGLATAVLILTRTPAGLKLSGIDLFEERQ